MTTTRSTSSRSKSPPAKPEPAATLAPELPSWLPAGARIVLGENGGGEAWLGRRRLARMFWSGSLHSDNDLTYLIQLDGDGKSHGLEIERDDGRVTWISQWVHGKQHGAVMQFDADGVPQLATEFVNGRGTDVWGGDGRTTVSEVRELADNHRHGYEWWGDPDRPYQEEHFRRGKRHGVFRHWDVVNHKLKPDYPQFYVNDKQVSLREYRAAHARDASLPAYTKREDDNRRPMPDVVVAALARGEQLRRDLALIAQVQQLGAARRDGTWPIVAATAAKQPSARKQSAKRSAANAGAKTSMVKATVVKPSVVKPSVVKPAARRPASKKSARRQAT